jgi:hypothetical protein
MRVALEPPSGIVSDDTTFSSEGQWADGNNVRFRRSKPQVIGGWAKQFVSTLTGVCRNVLAWSEASAGTNIAFGTHSKLQVYVSGALYDITPAGLSAGSIDASGAAGGWGTGTWGMGTWSTPSSDYYPRTWSLAPWGGTLLASPRGGSIYQWSNNTASVATIVAGAPTSTTAMLVTPQRQVLAIGCIPTAGGALNPLTVRGCAIEDLATWTPLSTNTAFEDTLDGGGRLITGRMVGDYVALWSDNALYQGEYTADTTQLYRWTIIGTDCGIVGQNAVAVYRGRAFWISPDGQFRSWAPGENVQIVPCPIRNDFLDNCDVAQTSKIIGVTIAEYDEIWFFYPDSRDTSTGTAEQSRYVALSLSELDPDGSGAPSWFRGQIGRTAFCDAGVQQYPMGVSYSGTVYQHEYGSTADGANLDAFIQCADQYIGTGEQCLQLQGIWPDFEDQVGDVDVTIYVREYPQSTAVTKGPYTLSEGQSKKDFRASGRVASIKISSSDAPSFWRAGKPTFQAVQTGLR